MTDFTDAELAEWCEDMEQQRKSVAAWLDEQPNGRSAAAASGERANAARFAAIAKRLRDLETVSPMTPEAT